MQNTSLYSKVLFSSWRKKETQDCFFLGVFSVIVFAAVIGFSFLISDETFWWIVVLFSLLSASCAWSWIYLCTSFLLPLRARKRLLETFKNAKEVVFAGEIVSCSKKRTVLSFVEVTLLEIRNEKGTRSFYFDSFLGACPLKAGMKVALKTKTNFVVNYEVKENEEASN